MKRTLALLLGLTSLGGARCPFSGLEPPCETPEQPIRTGLTFLFGGDPSCSENGTPLCANSIGQDDGDRTIPEHLVTLAPFSMDQTEVTNLQYRACVDNGLCKPPVDCINGAPFLGALSKVNAPQGLPGLGAAGGCRYEIREFDELPVVAITWDDARKYCEWKGKTLPSEAQWERAAVGPRGVDEVARKFPWGDTADFAGRATVVSEDRCDWPLKDRPTAVRDGARQAGRSVEGIYDLTGNVREWTLDVFDPGYYCRDPANTGEPRSARNNDCGGASRHECLRSALAPLPGGGVDGGAGDAGVSSVPGDPNDGSGSRKVVRGGAFCSTNISQVQHDCDLHTRSRAGLAKDFVTTDVPALPGGSGKVAGWYSDAQLTGFRCVRTSGEADSSKTCAALP